MKKTTILWLSAIACNGNVHSFFNYSRMEQFLADFEFIYHPSIDSKYSLKEVVSDTLPCDILIIDGTISDDFERAGENIIKVIKKYAKVVKKIVTVGTCATYGGIFRESPFENPRGLHFDANEYYADFADIKSKTVSVPGCPIHPEVLAGTLYGIRKDIKMKLDAMLRPKEYFSYLVHNGCMRNEYFEYKVDKHEYGNLEGCLFYDHGCQAPFTHGSCNKILWNEVNSKTRSGSACMGCTEPEFPKTNLFNTKKNMGIPDKLPLGVAKRTYLTFAGIAKAFKIPRLEKKLFDD